MSLSFPSIWVPGSSFILASCLIGKEAISSILLDQWVYPYCILFGLPLYFIISNYLTFFCYNVCYTIMIPCNSVLFCNAVLINRLLLLLLLL